MQLHKTPLDRLLQRHVEMAAEIKNLDSDMQMLVYENYNKFISATDTIRRYMSELLVLDWMGLDRLGCAQICK